MNEDRVLALPDRCRSAHGVFTAAPLDAAADFPAPADALLRRFGATPDDLDRLASRPFVRMFTTETSVDQAAAAVGAARRAALDLAAAHDGVVVDLTIPRVVTGSETGSDTDGAARWVAVDVDPGGLTTRGLEAFGLPELRLDGVRPDHAAAAIAVLLGLAERLLTEWPDRDPVGPATVTLHDVALAYGDPSADEATPAPGTDLLLALRDGELVLTLLGDPATDLFG